MKRVISERQEIDYDAELFYPHNTECPFKCGDEVKSGVKDGTGTTFTFARPAWVAYIEQEYIAGVGPKATVLVQMSLDPWGES